MISDIEKTKLQKEVIIFLSDFSGIKIGNIGLHSSLSRDLKMEGDDAVELLSEFGKRFNIDMTQIDPNDYFVSEACFNPLFALWIKVSKKEKTLKPLYVYDLINKITFSYENRNYPLT